MNKLIILLLLASCAKNSTTQSTTLVAQDNSKCMPTAIQNLDVCEELKGIGGEGFPFVWQGQLRYLSSARDANNNSPGLLITGPAANYVGPKNLVYVSGIVVNNTLYVYGVNGVNGFVQNQLFMTSSQDLLNWTEPVAILTSDTTEPYFNSSIAQDAQGYVLATEVHDPATGYYEWRISHSTTLQGPWSKPGPLYKSTYSACPTIRYSNGTYYVSYLRVVNEGKPNQSFVTSVTKSSDLVNWTDAPRDLFVPTSAEGVNMSDFDLTEYQGHLEMIIYDGDQATWGDVMRATYNGTFDQLMAAVFQP